MHVVITGASSGIGRALAIEYGRTGAALTLVARREELLRELECEVGRPCHIVTRDLSKLDKVADWIPTAEAVNGPIDVFINNAGVMDLGPTAELSVELGQRMLDVCLSAPLRLTRAVVPGMIARKSGTLVQVASLASFVAPPGGAWYGAAKAGLSVFSEQLRAELRGSGVNVLSVYPGPVATPLADGAYAAYASSKVIDAMPEGTAEELATLVRRSVDKRSRRLIYPRAYAPTPFFRGFFQWFTNAFAPGFKPTAPAKAAVMPEFVITREEPQAVSAASSKALPKSAARASMVAP